VALVCDGSTDATSDDLRVLVEGLVAMMEALHGDVTRLKSGRSASATSDPEFGILRRALPTEGEPVELNVLADWVESLVVRYAAAGDWLRPCWWRHGFVVEELAALRMAWLAVYDTSYPVDPTAGVKWHDEAERCRERIRRTISVGPGCSAISHKPDEPVTNETRWAKEMTAIAKGPSDDDGRKLDLCPDAEAVS
jgi:hypothetical protein